MPVHRLLHVLVWARDGRISTHGSALKRRRDNPRLARAATAVDVNRVHHLKSQILFALAHPTRIAILEVLREGEMPAGEISERLGLEQANCSQHLSILRAKEIVARRRSANRTYYAIGDAGVVRLLDALNAFIRSQVSHTVATLSGIDPVVRKAKR
jgi:DNA-binding transcriptional ArsR family regulator